MRSVIQKLLYNKHVQSVSFVSFHKCATSYFSSFVLKNVHGLKLIDYLQCLYNDDKILKPEIQKNGYIYGVIRLQDIEHPRYRFVKDFVNHKNFIKTRQVYFTRDPRDILISSYYSFGFTHDISKIEDIKKYEIKKRDFIKNLSLDEYALYEAPVLKEKFLWMNDLFKSNNNNVHLKYEDMIMDFDNFFCNISKYIPIDDNIFEKFYLDTRPSTIENIGHHKRSGDINTYKEKLNKSTINKINDILYDVLNIFKY